VLATWIVVVTSVAYLGLLFVIAYYGDRRADQGRSIISNGYVYALSLAVYATSWTFYGSVGRAASTGIGFLPIYLGATVMAALWWLVLRKIIRISKRNSITSLADFVSSRYGNSSFLGGLVTVIAVVGIVPYIALQLKAISTTFNILRGPSELMTSAAAHRVPVLQDTALYAALLLAAFTIAFGTRHLDATERHEGMVAAIAFEAVVKLVAFLAVGCYVTFVLFDGFGDLFGRAAARADMAHLFTQTDSYGSWLWLVVLSMLAILLLPRQWQVAVVENVDERHIKKAMWLFPLYLLLINVFVLPIAIAGLLTLGDGANADAFVLALPLADHQRALALLVFIGGLSAATGMVIVETIALSTMVSNSLVVPLLLRRGDALAGRRRDLGGLILGVRRLTIVLVLMLGFVYFRVAGEALALVSIGLISFAAVAQFAPAILGGLFWKGATRRGAIAGLAAGFAVWAYTLPLPSLAEAGWLPASFLADGPFGASFLAPHALFGLDGLDQISHSMMWSMLANVGAFVGLSLTGSRVPAEHVQAAEFVDVFRRPRDGAKAVFWRGTATVFELQGLLERFVGPDRARESLVSYAARTGTDISLASDADADLVHHVETLLAGAVGPASARFMVASVVDEEPLAVSEVLDILDETSQVLAYSRALEQKSRELEAATERLQEANERLQELDRLKDDFVSTVSHELRTPLTSIRAFSEILVDNPDLVEEERQGFLATIVDETERLTRLINQVLDLSKLESGRSDWHIEPIDLRHVVATSAQSAAQLFRDKDVALDLDLPEWVPKVEADRDRVMQVVVNLLSNAVKFSEPGVGRVSVRLVARNGTVRVDVSDDGPGIAAEDQRGIFEKFRQGGDTRRNRPAGTGLGLPISREIVDHLGGRLWVESKPGCGATFSFTLPIAIVGSAALGAETED
jgi:Na+/proline symporter/nitrogen-specific signal transduction histidine kinase